MNYAIRSFSISSHSFEQALTPLCMGDLNYRDAAWLGIVIRSMVGLGSAAQINYCPQMFESRNSESRSPTSQSCNESLPISERVELRKAAIRALLASEGSKPLDSR